MSQFIPYELHHHFGGRLPSQDEALHGWTAYLLQKGPLSVDELVSAFRDGDRVPQPITVERLEARQILSSGVESGSFIEVDESRFALHSDELARLQRTHEQALRDAERAEEDFREHVLKAFPAMHSRDISELWMGLRTFTTKVVLDYISKTAALDSRYRSQELIGDVFPEGSVEHKVACATYSSFLQAEKSGKWLFANALSAAVYAFRTSISEGAASEIRAALKHRVLYLDTNVIFSIIGLRGEPEYEEGTRRLLELAQQQGFTLEYTPATKREYAEALDRVGSRLISADSVDYEPEYVWQRRRGSIYRAYFLQRNDRTPREFTEYFRDLPARLSQLEGLTVGEAYVPDSKVGPLLESPMYENAMEALASIEYGLRQREHDAFNLALVLSERADAEAFSRTPSWFITQHGALAGAARRFGTRFPVAMTLDAWVLHFRRFLSRVEDFDHFLVDMIANNVFASFRLEDDEADEAARYLQVAGNREAGEVIAGVLQRTSPGVLRRVLHTGEGADEVTRRLLSHDKELQEDVARHAERVSALELEEKETDLAEQRRALDDAGAALAQARREIAAYDKAREERDEALKAYRSARESRDTVSTALQVHRDVLKTSRKKLQSLVETRQRVRLVSVSILVLVTVVVWLVRDSGPVAGSGILEDLALFGMSPVLVSTVAWWLVGRIYAPRVAKLVDSIYAEELEIAGLEARLAKKNETLESLAEPAGLA